MTVYLPPSAVSPGERRVTNMVTTSFILENLHCSTCVSAIQRTFRDAPFSPSIRRVSPNVVTSVVTVEHLPDVSIPDLAGALENTGFEICGVTSTTDVDHLLAGPQSPRSLRSQQSLHMGSGSSSRVRQPQVTSSFLSDTPRGRWERIRDIISHSTAARRQSVIEGLRRTHLENCEQCRSCSPLIDLDFSSFNIESFSLFSPKASNVRLGKPNDTGDALAANTQTVITRNHKQDQDQDQHRCPPIQQVAKRDEKDDKDETDDIPDLPSIPHTGIRNLRDLVVMSSRSLATIESETTQTAEAEWKVTVAIGGMTCAACANAITEALHRKPWIHSVAVNLMGNSATIEIMGRDKAAQVTEEIEDIGFEATLGSIVKISEPNARVEPEWRAIIAVGGMTCAACSNTITEALSKKVWIDKIAVNLVTNSATVDLYDKEKAQNVVEEIEDLGFEATLDTVIKAGKGEGHGEGEVQERTAEIIVDGFYCSHCPRKVVKSLEAFGKRVTIESLPTFERPIVKVKYLPEAPSLTIRLLIQAVQAADPAFQPSVYHPPSIEERAKEIRARHQRQILYRVVFTGLVAIPTFILGIVYMSLVPEDNPARIFLMTPWASGINRAQIALCVLATPVYLFAADLFHRRAFKEVRVMWRRGSTVPILQRFYRFGSMNTLMSLGTSIAYISSVSQMISAAVAKNEDVTDSNFYFDSVVFLTFFLLLGRLIESYTKSKTGDAVEELGKLRPNTAILVESIGSDREKDTVIAADTLEFGDVVRIPNGSSPPCDGVVVHGTGAFDESSLTGESRLMKKEAGDKVYAGTVNKNDPILVSVTGVSGGSMLDHIVTIVREGQTKRAPMEQIADLMTTYFVPAITAVAILTWITWLILGVTGTISEDFLHETTGGWVAFSLQFAIAVFVVACPCGLALAAPTAIFVGGGLAAHNGILAKGGGEAFEKASKVDVVVFDKTGTLTEGGAPTITDHELFSPDEEEKVGETRMRVVAALKAVEENSSHPIAKAVVGFCENIEQDWEVHHVEIDELHEIPGRGMKALCLPTHPHTQAFELIVGNEPLMRDCGTTISETVEETLETWEREAKSIALVATRPVPSHRSHSGATIGNDMMTSHEKEEGHGYLHERPTTTTTDSRPFSLNLALAISDPIRPSAPATIRALHKAGLRVYMLSGDNNLTAQAVATRVGIHPANVIAQVLPAEKAERIERLQSTLHPQRRRQRPLSRFFSRHRAHDLEGQQQHYNDQGDQVEDDTTRRATVMMLGDGINDSPALTASDVGVAIGSGADVAISSAAFVLVNSDVRSVFTLLELSRVVFRRIKFNFGWAVIYNLIMVPLAAGCLYPLVVGGGDGRQEGVGADGGTHVKLDPVWASLAMALSSVSVVCSSLMLRTRWWGVGFRGGFVAELDERGDGVGVGGAGGAGGCEKGWNGDSDRGVGFGPLRDGTSFMGLCGGGSRRNKDRSALKKRVA